MVYWSFYELHIKFLQLTATQLAMYMLSQIAPTFVNYFDLSLLEFCTHLIYSLCHLVFGLLQVFSQTDLTLKDIELVEVCEFESLKHIASSERQMQFLQVLSKSQHFVKWLQKETKSKCLYTLCVHISINGLVGIMFGKLFLCGLYISLKLSLSISDMYINSYVFPDEVFKVCS